MNKLGKYKRIITLLIMIAALGLCACNSDGRVQYADDQINYNGEKQREEDAGKPDISEITETEKSDKSDDKAETDNNNQGKPEHNKNGIAEIFVSTDATLEMLNTSKDSSISGSVRIVLKDGKIAYDGEMKSLKGRGNTSWSMVSDQKPYNIKLAEKAELIPGSGAAKKWCLLSGDLYNESARERFIKENPMLASMMGFRLYKDIGGDYALDFMPVDLYFNDDYRGCYLLTEAVEISPARVNITQPVYSAGGKQVADAQLEIKDGGQISIINARYSPDAELEKQGGIILEIDNSEAEKEDCFFITTHGNRFLFKDPDMPSKDQLISIAEYVQAFENALYSDDGYNSDLKYYADYFDLDSIAKEFSLRLLATDGDIYLKSVYWSVDVNADGSFTKLKAGPAWDFDACFYGVSDYYQLLTSEKLGKREFIPMFLKHEDFVNKIDSVITQKAKPLMQSYIAKGGAIDKYISECSKAKAASFKRWPGGIDFNADASTPNSAAALKAHYIAWTDYFFKTLWKDKALISFVKTVNLNQ